MQYVSLQHDVVANAAELKAVYESNSENMKVAKYYVKSLLSLPIEGILCD